MLPKLLSGIAALLLSVSCAAQVAPAASSTHPNLSSSLNVGMDYWSADWGGGKINRWGPSVSATVTIWHDLSFLAESHSMTAGGNQLASGFKYFTGEGGLAYISDYWGRFQPLMKGEIGLASLTHPPNGTGHLHETTKVWTFGAGFEYHTWGKLWTRAEYSYDFVPDFHSSITNQNHTLNPRGFTFSETYRFGPSGSSF